MALFIAACSSDHSSTDSSIVELEIGSGDVISAKRVSGDISEVGEVDLYHVRAVETNRMLQIKVSSETYRPDVDLLIHVFEKNNNGDLVMLAGDHAPVDSPGAVTVKVNVFIDEPKDLYIHVRDLMDDHSSPNKPYYISAYYEGTPDGNGSFETATDLVIDGDDEIRDSIGSEDDADCFRVTVTEDGVYDIFVDFDRLTGSSVRLSFTIYNSETGDIIETRKQGNITASHMVHYLEADQDYIVVVSEDGKDSFDTSSIYEISVEQRNAVEVMGNDTISDAVTDGEAMFDGASIDYYEDLDVYEINSNVAGDIKLLNLQFESVSVFSFTYRIELYTAASLLVTPIADAIPVFSHDYRGGDNGDMPFQVAMKLDPAANYYMVVRAASGASVIAPALYTADVEVTGITDADESVVHGDGHVGNDIDHDSIDLTAQPAHTGKIAFRADVDYYKVAVPANNSSKQVLSFALDIPATDLVQYAMKITGPGLGVLGKTIFNSGDDQRTVDLKTSFLVPESTTDSVYIVKVYDFQDDNGEDASFQLSWNVVNVHGAPAACPKAGGNANTFYHNENDEDGFPGTLTITYPDTKTGNFKVNNEVFDITDTVNAPRTGSDPVVISYPWVSGYIDYQNDEDWFTLDLSAPLNNADANWYYTISVEMYANGSPVEYTWEYMPDSDGNSQVSMEGCRPADMNCRSGILASDGDRTLASDLVNLSLMSTDYIPESDSSERILWVGKGSMAGSVWSGKVFFRISDFNYLRTGTSPNFTLNPLPDNDWGYEAPYYFRLTVKYYNNGLVPPAAN